MTEIMEIQMSVRVSTFFNIIPCIFFNMRANVRDISSFFNGGREGVETITDWGFLWLKLYLIEMLPPNNQYEQQNYLVMYEKISGGLRGNTQHCYPEAASTIMLLFMSMYKITS